MVDIKYILNNTYIIVAALIFIFISIFIITPANAELEIALNSLSPQPAEPGQDFVLSINLVNENSDVKNVMLEILPDSYIILKNEKDRIINIGNIIKYGAVAETYLLHIDSRAVSGSYNIDFRTYWLDNDQQRLTNTTMKVIVHGAPRLVISNISINPEHISPRDTFDLVFEVSNNGTGIAHDVMVSTITDGLPFVTVGADTAVLRTLDHEETLRLNYRIMVKDRADISSYSIPIKMEYKDENGENISTQSLVGIKILGKAELSIANIKTEPQDPVKDDPVSVTMRIENSGNGDAKSAKITFTAPFEGNKTAFLGRIKPNDDAPAVFTFLATESGDIPYSATLEYEDDLGVHTRTWTLNQYIYSRDSNSLMIPAGIFVMTAGTAMYYFSRRKKQ